MGHREPASDHQPLFLTLTMDPLPPRQNALLEYKGKKRKALLVLKEIWDLASQPSAGTQMPWGWC